MPVQTVLVSAAATSALTVSVMLVVHRIRQRIRTRNELLELIGQDQYAYVILDVRTEEEFRRGRIPSAMNIPFDAARERFPSENMFERIYVYGPNRRRAGSVARFLYRNGYFNVTNYGGFRGWKGPVESDTAESDAE